MRSTSLVRVAIVTLSLCAFATDGVGAASIHQGLEHDPTSQHEIADATRFRTEMGLDASIDVILEASMNRDRYPDYSWGVPLSVSEAEDMARRAQIQLKLDQAAAFAATLDDFAGLYIDQHDHGTPVFLFVNEPDAHRQDLAALLPADVPFRIETATSTLRQLVDAQDAVERAREELLATGTNITLIGTRIQANALRVGVEHLTAEVADDLHARFGSRTILVELAPAQADSCTSVTNCFPVKGGIEIDSDYDNFVGACTSGFLAKRTDTDPDRLVLVTAGHCIYAHGGTGDEWEHNNNDTNDIGQALGYVWQSNASGDVGLTSVYVRQYPFQRNAMLARFAPPTYAADIRNLSGSVSLSYQVVGSGVCRNGIASGYDCGSIVDTDVTRSSCINSNQTCVSVRHSVEVSFDSTNGDSGGPIFLNYSAYGIHIHSDADSSPDPHGWYTPVDQAQAAWQAKYGWSFYLCLMTSCDIQ